MHWVSLQAILPNKRHSQRLHDPRRNLHQLDRLDESGTDVARLWLDILMYDPTRDKVWRPHHAVELLVDGWQRTCAFWPCDGASDVRRPELLLHEQCVLGNDALFNDIG